MEVMPTIAMLWIRGVTIDSTDSGYILPLLAVDYLKNILV